MTEAVTRSQRDKQQIARFIKVLNHAMASGNLSQRGLCNRIDITIGTLTKYLRGDVPPFRVGLKIQWNLARELGVTLDALCAYYEEGEYATSVSVDVVESWIRSEAGQADLPRLMMSLTDAGKRWLGQGDDEPAALPPARIKPYTWPIEELKEAGVSDKFRERLGLTDEALKRLAEAGEFDEELAEAFSIACNYELEAVLAAFRSREPIA